jgi:hypothetical protein
MSLLRQYVKQISASFITNNGRSRLDQAEPNKINEVEDACQYIFLFLSPGTHLFVKLNLLRRSEVY